MSANLAYRIDDATSEAATSSVFSRQLSQPFPARHPSVEDYSISGTQIISLDEPRQRFWIQVVDARGAGELLAEAARSINSLLSLGGDWDTYNGLAPKEMAARKAISILSSIVAEASRLPSIVPVADGGIQLEWHNAGWDVEIEVHPDGSVSTFIDNGAFSETWTNHQLPQDPRFIEALRAVLYAE